LLCLAPNEGARAKLERASAKLMRPISLPAMLGRKSLQNILYNLNDFMVQGSQTVDADYDGPIWQRWKVDWLFQPLGPVSIPTFNFNFELLEGKNFKVTFNFEFLEGKKIQS
jgi:hypothetical protein